jgi:amino acid transporter
MKTLSLIKAVCVGRARSLSDRNLFHKVSLVALFAWVGLGADGLSSSCYGPEEMFKALGAYPHLALFVALASVVTILVICASYSQIISLFPTGGGGYLVGSKLLSPAAGVVSGSALLIDYVLTITISVASSGDALFSLAPAEWSHWKLPFAVVGVVLLTVINLRGVRESVMLWLPVFFVFIATHAFVIIYTLVTHASGITEVATSTVREINTISSQVGWFGLLALIMKAYSMGAGTFTGIEAVSNGLPILREPRASTGRRTMVYMGVSLAITVAGLLLAYLLFSVVPEHGKTLNAVLLERLTAPWNDSVGSTFLWVTLASEGALLFIAAQAGFLDGPRVLANMALDRWFPTRFAHLSDRFVTQNGILLMGAAALVVMILTQGSVGVLVVLYSINVFITFSISQLGMVKHWWCVRRTEPKWRSRLAVNGLGLTLTTFILVSLTVMKFSEGGWATLLFTGVLSLSAFGIHTHYRRVSAQLQRLDSIVASARTEAPVGDASASVMDPEARTAVLLVNGFNGLGLHTALHVPRKFGDTFRNYVFLQIGVVDAGNFKGADELDALREHTEQSVERYAEWARARGYGASSFTAVGHDLVGEAMRLARAAAARFPNHVFFAGQLQFDRETRLTRWLHNSTVFHLQRQCLLANLPFVILPIRIAN